MPEQDVLVQDSLITAMGVGLLAPPEAEVIEGKGCTLLPGLIDAHIHVMRHSLKQAAIFGVTTELDMCCPALHLLEDIRRKQAAGLAQEEADLLSAGVVATAPGGHGAMLGMPIPTLHSAEEAQLFVDARIAEGSDYIKIIYDDCSYVWGEPIPTLDQETVAATVEAAHQRGKLAVAHVLKQEDARSAIAVGVDGLAHLFGDTMPAPDFGSFVATHHAFVVPTLTALESVCGRASGAMLASDPQLSPYLSENNKAFLHLHFPTIDTLHYEVAVEAVRQLREAHVPILAGTDAPVPGITYGASLHRELELLVEAGLSAQEALTAATATPARVFGLLDRGRIAPELRADLLLVQGDPTSDIYATRAIQGVWKGGHRVDREGYRAHIADSSRAISGLLSNFEDERWHTSFGAGWEVSTDRDQTGYSTAEARIVAEGATTGERSLLVTGEIAAQQSYTHAGVLLHTGVEPLLSANMSSGQGLSFWARGDGRSYRVRINSAGHPPAQTTFVTGRDWQQIHLPFSAFGALNSAAIVNILFSADSTPGAFWFQLDDIAIMP